MPDQTRTIVRQAAGWRWLKGLLSLALVALTGCFGAEAMHYDIQEYNKQAVSSEKEMLLYNIAALHDGQPPHFMMLATISQSRTFSGTAGFSWTNPATWSVPFAATNTESPTIQFVPIQGQDFANRFESPVTDKFVLFSEDKAWIPRTSDTEELVTLFAQSLFLLHGENGGPCSYGLHENDGSPEFLECVHEIVDSFQFYTMIDGSHPVPTIDSIAPLGADIVTALGAGYKWTGADGKYQLTTPSRIPAWLDYEPKFVAAPESKPEPTGPLPLVWSEAAPKWQGLQYTLPKNYQWKTYKSNKNDENSADVHALVPDGYDLARDLNGKLKPPDKNGHYVPVKTRNSAVDHGERFSYADEVVKAVWPVTKDYFYVELRKNKLTVGNAPVITDAVAKRACFPEPNDKLDPGNNVVCGYFKIGNLLQIMRRLARPDMVCRFQDQKLIDARCTQSIFGIADSRLRVPSWAENSAPYKGLTGRLTGPYVYVPAHNPAWDSDRAKRDSETFFNLYKVYQMSLVDTSKLVTGAPAITIPSGGK